MNECLLLCICYHFVVFSDIVWSKAQRERVGLSTIYFVVGLLALNTLIIFLVNCIVLRRKCRICLIKRRMGQLAKSRQKKYQEEKQKQHQTDALAKEAAAMDD